MGFLQDTLSVSLKIVGGSGIALWITGMMVMLKWILSDGPEIYLYLGIILIGLSGLFISGAVIEYLDIEMD